MKLVALKSLSREKQQNISTLYGVTNKQPVLLAKWHKQGWIVLQHQDEGPLKKDKELVKVANCKNMEEVLEFLNKQKMNVFCPQESSEEHSKTPKKSKQDSIEKPGKNRKCYRKKVLLAGEYINPKTGSQGRLMVKDLSFYGISFSTNRPHDFQYDDIIKISFELDTPKRPTISRKVQIKNLDGLNAGGNIVNPPEWDYDLGAYLLPG